MLALSRTINPECEHLQGDMRSVRLGRAFDAIFIHDAICYMTSEDELLEALRTACTQGVATRAAAAQSRACASEPRHLETTSASGR